MSLTMTDVVQDLISKKIGKENDSKEKGGKEGMKKRGNTDIH